MSDPESSAQPRLFEVEKRCSKCGETKLLEAFHRSKTAKCGRQPSCKTCVSAYFQRYYRENHEYRKARSLQYGRDNRELRNERERQRYQENREYIREVQRKYAAENKEATRQRKHKADLANPGRRAELNRKWRQDNPEAVRVLRRRRRVRKQSAPVNDLTAKQWNSRVEEYAGTCHWCGRSTDGCLHMEHVIPLSRGGGHTLSNVVPACSDCNLSKNVLLPGEWVARRMKGYS